MSDADAGVVNDNALYDVGGDDGSSGGGGPPLAGLIASAVAQKVAMDEADVELLRNFGEHKLMDRVQVALEKQLRSQLSRVEAELRDRRDAGAAARTARETAGAELYGVQQQVARLQSQLEGADRSVGALHDIRQRAEVEVKAAQETYAESVAAAEAEEARLSKLKGELDGVNDTLRHVEAYTKDMAAEIAVTKRIASKTGVEMTEHERAKLEQDLYIDSLVTATQKSTKQLALLEAQLAAQRVESGAADSALGDAGREMDKIRAEKRQLMSQWQSSLVAMRRRNEALIKIRASIAASQEDMNTMDAVAANIHKEIAAVAVARGLAQEVLDKEMSKIRYLEDVLRGLAERQRVEEVHIEEVQGLIEETDKAVSRSNVEAGKLEKSVRDVERERFLVDKQRFGIEDEIAELMNQKITSDKAAKAIVKDARKMIERVHEVELTSASIEEALSGAKVEALLAHGRLAELRETAVGVEGELRASERLIEKYESEIKTRADSIEKKMATVALLNRRFEKLVADMPEAENMGPLQAEIVNLGRDIAVKRAALDELQKRWLLSQSALVTATQESESKSGRMAELQSQLALLEQKRSRLDAAMDVQHKETRRLGNAVKTMHDDMARISALIAKNAQLSARLAANTSASEIAFAEELRALEKEHVGAEARIISQREEKGRLLDECLECERQIILWEKKILLERETQEALDPTVGESEIAGMEREIHRMKIRLEGLMRDQERLVGDMERAIEKREVLAMKNKTGGGGGGGGGAAPTLPGKKKLAVDPAATATKSHLKQRILTLRRDIEVRLKQAEEVNAAITAKQSDVSVLAAAKQTKAEEVHAIEARASALQRGINFDMYEKQKGIEMVSALLRMHQRLEAIEASGRLPPLTSDETARAAAKVAEAEALRENVRKLVRNVAAKHVELSDTVGRVLQLVDIAPSPN